MATRVDDGIKAQVLQLCFEMLTRLDEGDRRKGFENVGGVFHGELLKRAFDVAVTVQHDGDRAKAIAVLASNFDEADAYNAYEASKKISFEGWRSDVLCAIAGKLSNKHVKRMLEDAQNFDDPEYRAEVLTACLPYIHADKRDKAKRKALAAALLVSSDEHRAAALGSLTSFLEGEEFDRALNAIRKIDDGNARAKALASSAQQLSGKRRSSLAREALALVSTIKSDLDRVSVLSSIAPILDGELAEEALQHVFNFSQDWYGAPVLVALAPMLQGPSFEKALRVAESITHPLARARTLSGFLRCVSDKEALIIAVRQAFFEYLRSLNSDEQGNEERARILSLLAETAILDALCLSKEALNQIARHVIDICTQWQWM